MIRIQKVIINEFRGIRNFSFDLKGDNFAVCGPNGTGKSGIVDAVEFAFTGNISRLSGEGTGDLSVTKHGPHVDSREKPDQAYVEVAFTIVSSGKQATVQRTIKNVTKPKITPNDDDVKAVLSHIEEHPEFVLSRRELIRYVISKPGDRSKEVQALLRLDKLETLRTLFQKIWNACEKEIKPLDSNKNIARNELVQALGVAQLSTAEILSEINKRRTLLSLPEIQKLEANTSIKDGLATMGGVGAASKISKPQALEDIKNLNAALNAIAAPEFQTSRKSVLDQVVELNANAATLESLSRESLFRTALNLFDESSCPVCDTEWEPKEFRNLLNGKLAHLASIKKKRGELEKALEPITAKIDGLRSAMVAVSKYGPLFTEPVDVQPLKSYEVMLLENTRQLRAFLPLQKTLDALQSDLIVPDAAKIILAAIKNAVEIIPEPSQQDAARDYLIVGQEKLDAYRKTSLQLEAGNKRTTTAKQVLDKYVDVMNTELEKIYQNVEHTFRNFYRIINNDDESAFEAKLTPSMGKLGFDVDFYGRGFFPPGAYHSEGHQDGMGLCLYLALMEHLLGNNFTFAVLDDVLMSVDSGHRREVCTLLKQKFPNTQFILTTHDDIWLKHMKTAGMVKNNKFVHFRTWNVDTGPTEWNDRDIWKEISDHLSKNEIKQAASLLRNFLEYFSKEACHRLRAPVQFRGDAQFTLGDLLPPAIKRFRELLKEGRKAAESWGQQDKVAQIEALQAKLEASAKKSEAEQWQVNTAIHYNEWANFSKNDFIPVVEAFKALLQVFECVKCSEVLRVLPERGKKEALKCSCNEASINLVTKPQ
ncbi:MAG TPA: ATP-binding protein [Rickettsiales bacterium]|nr:ATP-binding protein [Rickettsiales bacterium]